MTTPLIHPGFNCPNCEIAMEYREDIKEPSLSDDKNDPVFYPATIRTSCWICPDCPVIVFEYIDRRNIDALYRIIK